MLKNFRHCSAGLIVFLALFSVPPIQIIVLAALYLNLRGSFIEKWRVLRTDIRKSMWFPRVRLARRQANRKLTPYFEMVNYFVDEKYEKQKLLMGLSSLAVILSVALLFEHLRASNAVNDYLDYGLKQVLLTVMLGVSILALAWVLLPLETMFKSLFVKFVASIAVSACFLFARLLATDFFSTHFPFPPSYMSIAYGLAIIIIATSFASIVFALLTLLFECIALVALGARDLSINKYATLFFTFVSFLGLVGAWIASTAVFEGIHPKGQLLMVKLAEKYDFTTNHMCEAYVGESVLFIDNVSDRAIAATFPPIKNINPKTLAGKNLKKYLPTNFHTVRCNPLSAVAKNPGWCEKSSRFGFCASDE